MKNTKHRQDIFSLLSASPKPLSYEDMKESFEMDKATFYRNMSKFEEKGLVTKFESDNRRWYFEVASTPHAHFVCKICSGVECLEVAMPIIEAYKVESMTLKGVCKNCLV